jgi:hypothetical protein
MLRGMRPTRAVKPALPRAPLPRQVGGPHPDETKRLPRKRKHKKRPTEEPER